MILWDSQCEGASSSSRFLHLPLQNRKAGQVRIIVERKKIATWKTSFKKHLLIWETSTKVLCLWWGWNMKSSRFKMLDPTLVQIPDRCYCAHFPAKRFKSEMSKSIHLNSTVLKSRQIFSFISSRFLGGDNPDTFFSRPQRSRCSISMLVVQKDLKLFKRSKA